MQVKLIQLNPIAFNQEGHIGYGLQDTVVGSSESRELHELTIRFIAILQDCFRSVACLLMCMIAYATVWLLVCSCVLARIVCKLLPGRLHPTPRSLSTRSLDVRTGPLISRTTTFRSSHDSRVLSNLLRAPHHHQA